MAKSLFNAVLMVAIFSCITRILGFVFRIYLSWELGAELLGVYQIASSVFMVLLILVSSGLPLTVSKLTAKNIAQKSFKANNKVATSALVIGLLTSVILSAIIFLFSGEIGKMFTDFRCMEILLILLPAVIASSVYSAFRGSLWGQRDYFSVGLTELVEQILRILFFVVMVEFLFTSADKGVLAGWSLTISCVLSALLSFVIYLKKGGRVASPKEYIGPVLKSSASVTGVRAISSLIQPIIAIIFPAMLVLAGSSNETALSLYGIAMGMTFPLLFLPSTLIGSLSFALIPELSTAIAKKENALVEERIKSGLLFAVIVSALIIPLYLGLGPELCEFIYGNKLSGEFLMGASFVMIPLGLSNITSSILNALNLEVKSFVNNILGGVALLLCVVCLTGILGVYALILGFGLCMTVTTVLNLIKIKKHLKIKLGLLRPLLLSVLFVFPCAFLANWTYKLCLLVFPNFVALVLGACVSLASFMALCLCFKLCNFAIIFSKIKNLPKFHRKKA